MTTTDARDGSDGPSGLDGMRAHWIEPDLLALPEGWGGPGQEPLLRRTFRLGDAPRRWRRALDGVVDAIPLVRAPDRDDALPPPLRRAGRVAWTADVDADRARDLVRGEVAVVLPDGRATGVQLARLLDVVADATGAPPLGAQVGADGGVTLRLWAPTALDVAVEVLDVLDPVTGAVAVRTTVPARRDGVTGVWRVESAEGESGPAVTVGTAYRWVVLVHAPATGRLELNRVTDPWSHALTVGASASVVVDLTDPALAPPQWRETPAPRPARQVDHMITELHVRDLSRDDPELPAAERGTYRAFTRDIAGTRHLRALAEAGVTTVHLLPVFDIATIDEDRTRWPEAAALADPVALAALPPDSPEQQRRVGEANAVARAFNWGYDPLHVLAPEGSYAVDAHGADRCVEVREMVGALHDLGLAVVLDQVYNHTHACGQDPTSVLCRVVPAYFTRLSPDGDVETSTCCPNVATEHAMAQRWMVDAVVHWARHYRVDGFRFDLMGHHSHETMLAVRHALDALTVAEDGVDGAGVLLYGEGWSFGEVADDALFVQACQGALGGTGIATFSDRLRDASTGGTPSDRATLRTRGLATGLVDDAAAAEAGARAEVERLADLVRLGVAGNLRGVRVRGDDGPRGDELVYAGQAAGYADEVDEVVTYVDAHDNETLYDAHVWKLPPETPMPERVARVRLALAAVAWSQTIGFWHAGTELLRSKSLDRDSYDSGDWFNRVDWTGRSSTFGSGLPPAEANEADWEAMAPLLADRALRPGPDDMAAAREAALAVLRVRRDVPLLRLGTAERVLRQVSFPRVADAPGLVAVLVDDAVGTALTVDAAHEAALVVLHHGRETAALAVPQLAGRVLVPARPEIAGGAVWDAGVGVLTVPGLTATVWVVRR